MGCILSQLFAEVSPLFPVFSYAVVMISTYCDGGSRVVFLYLCLIRFTLDRRKRKLFSDNNCSALTVDCVVELLGVESLPFFVGSGGRTKGATPPSSCGALSRLPDTLFDAVCVRGTMMTGYDVVVQKCRRHDGDGSL